jgi:hypothetical protein
VALGYRYLHTDQFFLGDQLVSTPGGQPIIFYIHSVDLDVSYAMTDRLSLSLSIPFSYGTQSRLYADSARHVAHAFGLGDVSVLGTAWVLDPRTHPRGNVALGLGVKTPTGSNKVTDAFFLKGGSSIQYPVDQSIEPGDGGWGVILQLQAFQKVLPRAFGYFTGSYLLSPRAVSDVLRPPPSTVPWSVPDVYSGRLGVTYNLLPEQGVSARLGGRIDGIPYHDVIGGSDGFRRPGYVVFVEPGVAVARGGSTLTFSAPIRVYARLAQAASSTIGAGDLAPMLIFAGYSRRF